MTREPTEARRVRAPSRSALRVAAATALCLVIALGLRMCARRADSTPAPPGPPVAGANADRASDAPRRERPHDAPALDRGASVAAASEPDAAPVRCVVRDVRTGDAVPGVEVCGRTKDVSWTTRADGSFEAERDACCPLAALRIRSAESRSVVAVEDHASAADGSVAVLWTCSQVVIEGDVEVEGPLPPRWDASRVTVKAHLVPERRAGLHAAKDARWVPSAFIDADAHAGADGRFRIVVPAISGLEITGDALGWIPDRQTPFLEGATQGAPIRLHLTLQKAERLQGRCLDEDGKPVADAQVNCYVVLRESARGDAHVEDARASYPGGGVTVVSGPNGTQMTVRRAGRTDADGRFDIPIVAHGETVLVARARGRTIARQAVARSEFRDGATLTLRSSPDAARKLRIVARTGGDPVVRCQCVVGDLDTGYPFQPAFTITTDDRGDLPTEWLEDGHLYMIVPCQPSAPVAVYTCGGRFFRWSGQSSLALLDLPTQPNEVR